jgi:hypothetical protein
VRQGWTQLDVAGLTESTQLVRHVAFPTPKRGVRNAFDTMFTANGGNEGYRQVVDAETGEILLRESIVDNLADNPLWYAFPANPNQTPLGRYPWNYRATTRATSGAGWTSRAARTVVANAASPRLGHERGHEHADVHDDRQQQRQLRGVARQRGDELPPRQPDARLPLSVDERLVHDEVRPRRTSWSAQATTSTPPS